MFTVDEKKPSSYALKWAPLLLILSILNLEMGTDLYIPSVCDMAVFYGVDSESIKLTLSIYLFGFSLLGCVSGPLSDSWGRRPVLLLGMGVFCIGSIACVNAPSIIGLLSGRFVQGLGAGMTIVMATAIIKDLYNENQCSKIFSWMGMVIALSPLMAPILGGIIAEIWSWKMCFVLIAAYGIISFVIITGMMSESLPPSQRSPLCFRQAGKTYGELLRNPEVTCYSLISGITYGGLWAWITEAPFYLTHTLAIPVAHYGYYAAIGPAAYMIGTLINQKFVEKKGIVALLRIGLSLKLIGSCFLLFSAFFFGENLFVLYFSLCFYSIGLAPVFANAATKAVDVTPNQRGTASALLSTIEVGLAGFSALIVSFISDGTLVPPACVILLCTLLCIGLYWFIEHKSIKQFNH